MIALRALGREWSEPESFLAFVRSEGFVSSRRPVFIGRSRNLLRTDVGEARSLPDSVRRLTDSGLLTAGDVENSVMSWTRRDSYRRVGFCSTMFRVVGISLALDSPDLPDSVVDYVVYHECLHLRQGYLPTSRVHDARFRSWEHEYPGWRECEAALRSLGDIRGQRFYPSRRCRPMDEGRGFVFEGSDGRAEYDINQVTEMASRDVPDGVYALAMAYLFGWDVEADEDRGYGLLERAVELGQTDAMTLMVRLYMEGEYGGIDRERAAELAMTAAEDGIPEAQMYAGLAYMDGVSVGQDYGEAARLLTLAANRGEQEARTSLAYLYENGLGVPRDEAKAYRLYRTAARAGSVNAMYHAGVCCEFGIGTPVDEARAAEWYSRGAGSGDAFAAERLGHLTVTSDAHGAFELFLRAALDGVPTAMGTVGMCYLRGTGVEASTEEARKWLRLAADNGVEEAAEALADLDG